MRGWTTAWACRTDSAEIVDGIDGVVLNDELDFDDDYYAVGELLFKISLFFFVFVKGSLFMYVLSRFRSRPKIVQLKHNAYLA